jgi:hypothetical protein
MKIWLAHVASERRSHPRLGLGCPRFVQHAAVDFQCLPPWSPMFQHRIEDDQQLAHARHERDLLGLARCKQTVIERLDDGIKARGHEGAHIQCGADRRAATPDGAPSSHGAAVAVERPA